MYKVLSTTDDQGNTLAPFDQVIKQLDAVEDGFGNKYYKDVDSFTFTTRLKDIERYKAVIAQHQAELDRLTSNLAAADTDLGVTEAQTAFVKSQTA